MAKKKRPTKAQREHMDRVVQLGCIVCLNLGYEDSPAEFHHTRTSAGGAQKSDVVLGIPLCPIHHRTGGPGLAIHAGQKTWEAHFGTEEELIAQVHELLGVGQWPITERA
ncbi:MAG: Ref family recombination enhancement nuclease [Pseudomonadota bacterium]